MNEKDYDDKYTMGAYRIAKENPSIEALTMDQAMTVIKFPNLLIHFESNFSKELIERERWYMANDAFINNMRSSTMNIMIEIVFNES